MHITYLAIDAEFSHGVNDAQESRHGLGLLANHGLVNLEIELVVVKVLLNLVTVDIEDVLIHDGEATTPSLVAVGEVGLLGGEDVVDEGEVVLDLLVALDVETILGLRDGGLHVRHGE